VDSTMVGAGTPLTNLPVTLISFTATGNNKSVDFKWQVENEINLLQYNIEYSTDGNTFGTIGQVKAADLHTYYYSCSSLSSVQGYYRLKMIDIDGAVTYSNIVEINITEQQRIKIYPNPAKDNINIYTGENVKTSHINIIDATGRVIKELNTNNHQTSVKSSQFANGLYIVQLIENDKVIQSAPFIINR